MRWSWWQDRPPAVDTVFGVAVGVLICVTSVLAGADQADVRRFDAVAVAVVAAGSAGVAVRRRWPAVGLVLTLAATLLFLGLGYPYGPIYLLGAIAMYSIAAWRGPGVTAVAAVVTLVVHVSWAMFFEAEPDGLVTAVLGSGAWIVAAVGAGVAVRTRRETYERALAEDRRRLGYEERLRLAQEVHDSVGHSLAVISMNAGAALHVLGKAGPVPPEPLHRSLRAIRQASNGALGELRTTLAAFTATLAPPDRALGLGLVPALVTGTDVDGLTVAFDVDGTPSSVPAPVDLAGYRIVQEALANVVRHAGARRAGVRVAYRSGAVAITVTDDGRGGTSPTGAAGTGLASMRDRAHAVGGTLTAGPQPTGGFRVHAHLPYRTS